MLTAEQRAQFVNEGFVVLPSLLSEQDLVDPLGELDLVMPSATEFHCSADETHQRFRDEFGGITAFPFASTELSLLAVHQKLVSVAAAALRTDDLRAYSLEAWGKYTGAATYEQPLHRDYLAHSLLVPTEHLEPLQVEMFVYLQDVTPEHGATAYCPLPVTAGAPALPNWFPATDDPEVDAAATESETYDPPWGARQGRPNWYEHEVVAAGPAGTVVIYRNETFHRGRDMTVRNGARYTLHVNFRRADAEWITRRSWTDSVDDPTRLQQWNAFVRRATPAQLQLFGFPPPGHPYWTPETGALMTQRYPGFQPEPWLTERGAT